MRRRRKPALEDLLGEVVLDVDHPPAAAVPLQLVGVPGPPGHPRRRPRTRTLFQGSGVLVTGPEDQARSSSQEKRRGLCYLLAADDVGDRVAGGAAHHAAALLQPQRHLPSVQAPGKLSGPRRQITIKGRENSGEREPPPPAHEAGSWRLGILQGASSGSS